MPKTLPIAQLGSPVIRTVARSASDLGTKAMQEFIDDLIVTCSEAKGMGISAPQVYRSERIMIMSSTPNERYPHAPEMEPTVLIDPEISWQSEESEKDWEGCLSLPGIRALVARSKEVRVSYRSRDGEHKEASLKGFLARLFLHEFDHLNGIVFIDRVDSTLDIVMEQEFKRIITSNDEKRWGQK